MTMLIRGAALTATDRAHWSLLDLAEDKPAMLDGLDFASDRSRDSSVLELDDLAAPGFFCELELANGSRVWLRPEELEGSTYFEHASTRGQRELVPRHSRERGIADLVVRLLKVFKVDPVQLAGNLARERLVTFIERKVEPKLALLGAGPSDLQPFDAAKLAGDKPCLLMLHGTFSSTRGSFGGLQTANGGEDWRRLSEFFGPRMLALEHRTASMSPLENAIELVSGLPDGLRLHLLSHSRGGLIGELLSRRDGQTPGFSAHELAVLDALDPALASNARKLDSLLRAKELVVERFVRVACPTRGTTIGSDRGREWLTVFVNLLADLFKKGSDAALGATGWAALMPIAHSAIELLQALTLETIQIRDVPGLYAMDPASNFIRGLINSEHARAAGSLAVVAGDTEGSGVLGRLKMFAVDTFFERDNDLVVDTDSMVGGAQRQETFRFLARGDDINHFRYFGGARTATVISKALTTSTLAKVEGLQPFTIQQHALRTPLRTPPVRSGRRDLPIVFLLPGIMGTQLKVEGETVWADHWELVRGGFARLRTDAAGIGLGALDGDTYQSLADALAIDHEVIPFPYDWRVSIDAAAQNLNDVVRARLADAIALKRPMRFVAHSMGGLVVRALMTLKGSVWPELQVLPDRRFVMLGTPNQGSHAITLLLTGKDRLVQLLALADLRNPLPEIIDIAADFAGALDMAPTGQARDYFTRQAWADLAIAKEQPAIWPLPEQAALDRSRAFRQRLDQQDLTALDVYYIAGQAKDTPIRVDLKQSGGRTRLTFIATREGDGRVPWATGIPAGIKTWYVPAKHGDIPAYQPLHAALREILASGHTARLPTAPPLSRDLPGSEHVYPEARINKLPVEGDLIAAALDTDCAPVIANDEPLPTIEVDVVWGNLRYAKYPVVVGHYVGDTIISAESVLDTFLENALSRRLALGRYPGDIGTALVIPNARGELPGAVVIGLGHVATRLSRSDLSRAVRTGISEWAARMLESKLSSAQAPKGEPASRGLAFVAVGSGQGGMALSEVGGAILEGVQQAIELLRAQRGLAEVHRLAFTRIQFLELYEDRAHTLWHGLSTRAAERSLPPCMRFGVGDKGLGAGEGGRRRLVLNEADDWWSPLKITQHGSHLRFENIADRARAELRGVATHASQVNELLEQSAAYGDTDIGVCRALFAMLIPNDLKDSLPSGDRLRLLVDSATARYPWELILAGQQDRRGSLDSASDTAGNGVIRQFVTAQFRANPRMARAATALVIGDPETHKAFAPLPGALEEALAVHSTLAELGFALPAQVLRDAREILVALHVQPYQILHLAGHGIEDLRAWLSSECDALDAKIGRTDPAKSKRRRTDSARLVQLRRARDELPAHGKPISAMVIGQQQFLTYRNVEHMREVPELVFINCCHLGHIARADEAPRGQLGATAAGFAQKFIEIGVRAVIAAGWPVDDAAALTFADAFYRSLRRGQTFGEAVREARGETRRQHPKNNTWAAYQCYGDPSFRPTSTTGQSTGWQRREARYGSPRHLAFEGIQTASDLDELRARVANFTAHSFVEDGELCSVIGDAFRDLEGFSEAIRWYRKALADEKARIPLRGVECLLNMIVRAGQSVASPGQTENSEWLQQVDLAVALLEGVNDEYPTRERHRLIGSAQKRKAMALTGNSRLEALQASATAYGAATALSDDDPNPFINAAVMSGAASLAQGNSLNGTAAPTMLAAAKRCMGKNVGSKFWDFAADANLLVARIFLADLKLAKGFVAKAFTSYEGAFKRDRKKGNLASVIDQIKLMLVVLVDTQTPIPEKEERVVALTKLLAELEAMSP